VEPLEGETRLDELALMLGSLSEANRSAARETLENAVKRTKELAAKDLSAKGNRRLSADCSDCADGNS
jgi:hypothetical protein